MGGVLGCDASRAHVRMSSPSSVVVCEGYGHHLLARRSGRVARALFAYSWSAAGHGQSIRKKHSCSHAGPARRLGGGEGEKDGALLSCTSRGREPWPLLLRLGVSLLVILRLVLRTRTRTAHSTSARERRSPSASRPRLCPLASRALLRVANRREVP